MKLKKYLREQLLKGKKVILITDVGEMQGYRKGKNWYIYTDEPDYKKIQDSTLGIIVTFFTDFSITHAWKIKTI